ncbi:MAG TPA: inorganic diphosphatase, partial [Actinomycetes bacterium]|nr:inorganic diphosphatase [Actinomycetes bacterium]
FPGCEIQARIVGMLDMADDAGRDQKLLVVPLTDPQWNHIHRIDQVPPHLLREIEHFFSVYKTLEDKTVETFGWRNSETGRRILDEALARGAEHRQAGHGGSTVGA